MPDLVQLRGIRFLARCGATVEERSRFQPMEIDLDLEADQSAAGRSDDLNDAVDYEPICDSILKIAASEQFSLIEKMGQSIVDSILKSDQKIEAVEITLKKLRPPVQADLAYAAVKIRRTRA